MSILLLLSEHKSTVENWLQRLVKFFKPDKCYLCKSKRREWAAVRKFSVNNRLKLDMEDKSIALGNRKPNNSDFVLRKCTTEQS